MRVAKWALENVSIRGWSTASIGRYFLPRTGAHAHRCTELLGTSYSNSRGDPANTDMQQTDTEH